MPLENKIDDLFESICLMTQSLIEEFAQEIEAGDDVEDAPQAIRDALVKVARECQIDDGSVPLNQALICLVGACSMAKVWINDPEKHGDPKKLRWPPKIQRRVNPGVTEVEIETPDEGTVMIPLRDLDYIKLSSIHMQLLNELHRVMEKLAPETMKHLKEGAKLKRTGSLH